MRRLITKVGLCMASIVSLLSCSRDNVQPADRLSISSAREFFEKEIAVIKPRTESNKAVVISHVTDWSRASETRLNTGEAVVVPFKDSSHFSTGRNSKKQSNNMSYLLVYKQNGELKHQVVTVMPDPMYKELELKDFAGYVFVQDWSGQFKEGYRYFGGKYKPLGNLSVRQRNKPNTEIYKICEYIDWYTCVSYGGDDWECHYDYTVELGCTDDPNDPYGGTTGGGGPSGGGVDPGSLPVPGGGGTGGVPTDMSDDGMDPRFKDKWVTDYNPWHPRICKSSFVFLPGKDDGKDVLNSKIWGIPAYYKSPSGAEAQIKFGLDLYIGQDVVNWGRFDRLNSVTRYAKLWMNGDIWTAEGQDGKTHYMFTYFAIREILADAVDYASATAKESLLIDVIGGGEAAYKQEFRDALATYLRRFLPGASSRMLHAAEPGATSITLSLTNDC